MKHTKQISKPRVAQVDVAVIFDFLYSFKLLVLDVMIAMKDLGLTFAGL